MSLIEILPHLWIGTNNHASDIDFFKKANIRYVVNLTYDVPNYFKYVNYYVIPFESDKINEARLAYNMNCLFDMVGEFITKGYDYKIGIFLHDKTGNIAKLFAAAFMINKLKLTYDDVAKYYGIHNQNIDDKYIINYAKTFNNYPCKSY